MSDNENRCPCVTGGWREGENGEFCVGGANIVKRDGRLVSVPRFWFHEHCMVFGTTVTVDSSIDIDFCPFCGRKLEERVVVG